MKTLLVVTAVIEAGAGMALLCFPSASVVLLLGSSLAASAAFTLARVAGTALLSLGVACWFAHHDERSRAAKGLVAAMSLYNIGVAAVLAFAGIGSNAIGVALWAAVTLHIALAVWCFVAVGAMNDRPSG